MTPPSAPLTPNLRSRVVLQNEQGSAASIASTSVAQTDIDDIDDEDVNNEDNETVSSQVIIRRCVLMLQTFFVKLYTVFVLLFLYKLQ